VSFDIRNVGDGDAYNPTLAVNFGDNFTIEDISGATYDTTAKRFENIGLILAGNAKTLTYDVRYTPPTNWCDPGAKLSGATLTWEPSYEDVCHVPYSPPLRSSSYTVNVPANSKPSIAVTKTCTINGNPIQTITPLANTSQPVVCTITVNYANLGTPPANLLNVKDDYPDRWQVGSISPTPSGYNVNAGAIAWTIQAADLAPSGTGALIYTQNFTIPALGSDNICDNCGEQWRNAITVSGTDFCTCPLTASAEVQTTVECPTPEIGLGSVRTITPTNAEVCTDAFTFTSRYTFSGTGWNSVPWANNLIFTEQMENGLELVGTPTVTVTTPACAPTWTHSIASGDLVLNFTANGTCGTNISNGTVLEIQYQLRPGSTSQPACGDHFDFIDFASLVVRNTAGISGGVSCPAAGGGIVVRARR